MTTIKHTLLSLLLGMSVCSSATAALIIYDGFDYPAGVLTGNNGGSGNWTGAWAQSGSTGVLSAVSPGLSYGDLLVEGNTASENTTASLLSFRPFDSTGLTADGSTVWFSVLYNISAGGDATLKIFADNTKTGSPANYQTGVGIRVHNTSGIATDFGAASFSYSAFSHLSDANLVVGRVTFSGDLNQDRITLWVNPTLSDGMPSDGAAFADAFNEVNPALVGSDVIIRGGGSFIGNFDELRVGTTFADVAPVPEPAVFGVALALMALVMRLWSNKSRK